MQRVYNVNIEGQHPLPTPQEIHTELPLRPEMEDFVETARQTIENIIHRRDKRILIVTGPCSIDNSDAALDYAERLKALSKKVESKFYLVMRTYFEKPRTTIGWKGMVYDPDLDKTFNIEKGLRSSRKLLLAMAERELPTATEFLDPIIPQYLSDLISWAAIGARTTESQTHRAGKRTLHAGRIQKRHRRFDPYCNRRHQDRLGKTQFPGRHQRRQNRGLPYKGQ